MTNPAAEFFAVFRPEDGEKVGYLAMESNGFDVRDLLLRSLGHESEYDVAEQRLIDEGIGYLAGLWIYTPSSDVRHVVRIVSLDTESLTLSTGRFGAVGEPYELFTEPLPLLAHRLRPVADHEENELGASS